MFILVDVFFLFSSSPAFFALLFCFVFVPSLSLTVVTSRRYMDQGCFDLFKQDKGRRYKMNVVVVVVETTFPQKNELVTSLRIRGSEEGRVRRNKGKKKKKCIAWRDYVFCKDEKT